MSQIKLGLFLLLGLLAVIFAIYWAASLVRSGHQLRPTLYQIIVGVITDFLDTLGIGSFATTTALFRVRTTVRDELIPGTLNVGHCLPTFVQALIYIAIVKVDLTTLVLTILASVCGAWAGVGVVVQWPRHRIQRGMGLALLVAAAILLAKLTRFLPPGGSATGLSGNLLMIAMICNFVFGALMMIGVGAYAPIMIMISLLGMEPDTAFPIMMGSCAFLERIPFMCSGIRNA